MLVPTFMLYSVHSIIKGVNKRYVNKNNVILERNKEMTPVGKC